MPKLTPAVRIAASSILLLSVVHIAFWAIAGYLIRFYGIEGSQFTPLFIAILLISSGGLAGIVVVVGIFKARNWARIGALVIAGLTALASAFALLVLCFLLLRKPTDFFDVFGGLDKSSLAKTALVYLVVFSLAIWWILLFSRKTIAEQFSSSATADISSTPGKAFCPPPIALLAWLMIASSTLSALSWPLILGKIPAMLFTHIFSLEVSKWIWAANILLFLVCGIGLLKLQRWGYTGTIVLHSFWLVSPFVSQVSPRFPQYLGNCYAALQADQAATYFIHFNIPPLLSALTTAIPTALLITGLFYYRRSFLKAVDDSRHLSS
jgi:hypothetical protein